VNPQDAARTTRAHRRQIHRVTRRTFLQVGCIGGLGLSLDQFFRIRAARAEEAAGDPQGGPSASAGGTVAPAEGPARSVIHIFLPGGLAHQDSFDPKPYAPIEYRGSLGTIATKIEGVRFTELFKQTAEIADRITVCRSVTHGEADHDRGTHNMFTGYRPSPALVYPSMGSVVSHELGSRKDLPPYVCIPNQPTTFAGPGYLSSAYAPFSLGSDPAGGSFEVRDLGLPSGIDEARFARRRGLLEAVNDHFRRKESADSLDAMDSFYQRAYALLSSQEAREAFNLATEPDALKDEYGRNAAGMRMLLARRLVAAGVRFVSLTYGGWDMHENILEGLRNQVPPFDQAFAALLRDLERTGLFDSTLVMVTTEFGRTPKVNGNAGRDHWPKVFSVLLAGGGVKKGSVYGSSDSTAAEPDADPLTVEDLAATVYHQIGIDAEKELTAPGPRPIEIVKDGKVRKELLA
jgi:hypothetical protein